MGAYWHVTVKVGGGGKQCTVKHSKARTNVKKGSLGEHQLNLFIYTRFLSGPKCPTVLSLASISNFCHLVGCITV